MRSPPKKPLLPHLLPDRQRGVLHLRSAELGPAHRQFFDFVGVRFSVESPPTMSDSYGLLNHGAPCTYFGKYIVIDTTKGLAHRVQVDASRAELVASRNNASVVHRVVS